MDLPRYDSDASMKLQHLAKVFRPVAEFYNRGWDQCRADEVLFEAMNTKNKLIRDQYLRVFLSQFSSIKDLEKIFAEPHSADVDVDSLPFKARVDAELGHYYRKRLPYGQPRELEERIFANDTVRHSVQSFPNIGNYKGVDPSRSWVFCTTLVTTEITPNHINICFAATPNNGLPYKVDDMANKVAYDIMRDTGQRRPVQVFVHIPVEIALNASHQFARVSSISTSSMPDLIYLTRLPQAIDRGYYTHHQDINDVPHPDNGVHDAYRGFALRALGLK
jgi:hypothetical protein